MVFLSFSLKVSHFRENNCLYLTVYFKVTQKEGKIKPLERTYLTRSSLKRSHRPRPVGYIGQTAGPPSQNVQAGYMISWYSDVFNRNREVILNVLEQRKKQQTALISWDLEKALPLCYTAKDIAKPRLWTLKGKNGHWLKFMG